ncbi:hypothetical protein ACFV1N_46930 [Streptosporangium canum]|uniref:hypothetical protein n=1 Tax=Streptosporangium canum TaxID=324952 RepID=UPI0036C10966
MTTPTAIASRGEILARFTLEHLRADPDQWDQSNWRRCFGGTALKLTGGRLHDDYGLVFAEPDEPGQRIVDGVSYVEIVDRVNRLLQLTPGHGLFGEYTVCPCLGCTPSGRDIACTVHPVTLDDLEQMINELYGTIPGSRPASDSTT